MSAPGARPRFHVEHHLTLASTCPQCSTGNIPGLLVGAQGEAAQSNEEHPLSAGAWSEAFGARPVRSMFHVEHRVRESAFRAGSSECSTWNISSVAEPTTGRGAGDVGQVPRTSEPTSEPGALPAPPAVWRTCHGFPGTTESGSPGVARARSGCPVDIPGSTAPALVALLEVRPQFHRPILEPWPGAGR